MSGTIPQHIMYRSHDRCNIWEDHKLKGTDCLFFAERQTSTVR